MRWNSLGDNLSSVRCMDVCDSQQRKICVYNIDFTICFKEHISVVMTSCMMFVQCFFVCLCRVLSLDSVVSRRVLSPTRNSYMRKFVSSSGDVSALHVSRCRRLTMASIRYGSLLSFCIYYSFQCNGRWHFCSFLQCFDTVCWVTRQVSSP